MMSNMGTEYYLVNEKEQTLFELGKGSFHIAFDRCNLGYEDNVHNENVLWYYFEFEELYKCFTEEIGEYTYGMLYDDKEYCKRITDNIIKFCNSEMVYIVDDCSDYFVLLNRIYKKWNSPKYNSKYNYKQVGSRYENIKRKCNDKL